MYIWFHNPNKSACCRWKKTRTGSCDVNTSLVVIHIPLRQRLHFRESQSNESPTNDAFLGNIADPKAISCYLDLKLLHTTMDTVKVL
jgi:hypothetical protein